MKRSNKKLLMIFLLLIVTNVVFYLIGTFRPGVSFDEHKFTLTDTASVASIRIGDQVRLVKNDGSWKINDEYLVDASLRRLLLSIMSRVEVKKPVEMKVAQGTKIQITGEQPLSFVFWGNPTKTKTYFSMEGSDDVYEMQIPGYNEYIGGVLELAPDQWRDRLVIDASWRTIQNASLAYQESHVEDFTISFDEDFFVVEGVERLDSNAVVDYLNQFQFFQANEWISKGRFHKYDSLSRMPALATLSIQTLSSQEPFLLEIFPKLPQERFHLVMSYDQSMMVIDENRIREVLRKKNDFSVSD